MKVFTSEAKTLVTELDTYLYYISPRLVSRGFNIRHALETLKLSGSIKTLDLLIQAETLITRFKLRFGLKWQL